MENNQNKQINISEEVMKKIESGGVKMRPHWRFLAERIGVDTVLLLVLAVSIFIFSLVLHYWKINELHHLIGFGYSGIWRIIFSFPYELLAVTALLLILLYLIIRKKDWGYKHSFPVLISLIAVLMILLSGAVFAFGMHEFIEKKADEEKIPFVNNFYQGRLHNILNNTVRGKVKSINENSFELERPGPPPFKINKPTIFKNSGLRINANRNKLIQGDEVEIIGNRDKDDFKPWGVVIIHEGKQIVSTTTSQNK